MAAPAARRAIGRRSTPSCARCESLENDETLLVQSGRPVGIFRTHPEAPRVLIANSNLVGHWSNWDEFNRLERMGLTMYGQMTAGLVDLYRQPGHRAGNLRDLRRRGAPALRRIAGAASWWSPAAWAGWAARSRWPPP